MSSGQRRKRRSYSCGPCKKLKLRCNLSIPCGACEKAKRQKKCMDEPPHPPSQKELQRMADRRRKKDTAAPLGKRVYSVPYMAPEDLGVGLSMGRHPTQAPGGPALQNLHRDVNLPAQSIPPTMLQPVPQATASSIAQPQSLQNLPPMLPHHLPRDLNRDLPQNLPQDIPPNPALHNLPQQHTPPFHPTPLDPVYISPSKSPWETLSTAGAYSSMYNPAAAHPNAPLPIMASMPLGFLPAVPEPEALDFLYDLAYDMPPQLPPNGRYTGSDDPPMIPLQPFTPIPPEYPVQPTETSGPAPSLHAGLNPSLDSGNTRFTYRPEVPQSGYSFTPPPFQHGRGQLDIEDQEDVQTIVVLLAAETAQFQKLSTHSTAFFEHLHSMHRRAAKSHVEALLPTSRASYVFLAFLTDIGASPDTEYYTTVDTLRMVSLGLGMAINGLIYVKHPTEITSSVETVLEGWNLLLLTLHSRLWKNDRLADVLYLMAWVMVRQVYLVGQTEYDAFCELLQQTVIFLFQNRDFAGYVRERERHQPYPDSPLFQAISRVWLFMRILELEVPRFLRWQMNEAFNLLLTSLAPHRKAVEAVYRHRYVGDQEYFLTLASYYYRHTNETKTIVDLIHSYYLLYCDAYQMMDTQLNDLDSRLAAPIYVEQEWDVTVVVRNQLILSLFVRWLTFIRIESRYFPSLRYASYLTTQLNLFLASLRMDNRMRAASDGNRGFFEKIGDHGLFFLRAYYHCLVCQGVLLAVVANFLPAEHLGVEVADTAISFQYVFSECYTTYREVAQRLQRAVERSPLALEKTPEFRTTLRLIDVMLTLVKDLLLAPRHSFTQLTVYIEQGIDNIEIWQHLHRAFFGLEKVFVEYVEKVWDLFEFVDNNGSRPIPITEHLVFDQHMLELVKGRSRGITLTPEIVESFVEHQSRPSFERY